MVLHWNLVQWCVMFGWSWYLRVWVVWFWNSHSHEWSQFTLVVIAWWNFKLCTACLPHLCVDMWCSTTGNEIPHMKVLLGRGLVSPPCVNGTGWPTFECFQDLFLWPHVHAVTECTKTIPSLKKAFSGQSMPLMIRTTYGATKFISGTNTVFTYMCIYALAYMPVVMCS